MDPLAGAVPESEINKKPEPADFEQAISATGFGTYNLLLFLVAIPACLGTVYETSTMSFVLPSAECDLKLTLIDKGTLNAITYGGMISSAIIWGFLADTKGRQKILAYGYLADALFAFGGSLSQDKFTLMFFKFCGGLIVCGPFAVLMSYLSEFHGNKYRGRVMMVIGMLFSLATLILPGLAWSILPQDLTFDLIKDVITIHSWQIFIAVCAVPSLVSGIVILFLPESPKFLMSKGRNAEALEVFKTVYSINFRQPKESYPIKELVKEMEQKPDTTIYTVEECKGKEDTEPAPVVPETFWGTFREGLKQLRPMFSKQYLGNSLHVYTIQFCILMGLNTIRLWLPQLFTSITDYEEFVKDTVEGPTNLCAMLEYSVNKSRTNVEILTPELCEVRISHKMYVNSIIVSVAGLVGYFIAGSLINALGNKKLMIIGLGISGVCGVGMYWATNSQVTLVLSSLYVTVGSISSTSLLGLAVNLFPTSLRTMIVSVAMMFGRLGALIGNILFPYFLSMGCVPPFVFVGIIMLVGSILSTMLPADVNKRALK